MKVMLWSKQAMEPKKQTIVIDAMIALIPRGTRNMGDGRGGVTEKLEYGTGSQMLPGGVSSVPGAMKTVTKSGVTS